MSVPVPSRDLRIVASLVVAMELCTPFLSVYMYELVPETFAPDGAS